MTGPIQQRLQVSINFEITVRDLTDDVVRSILRDHGDGEALSADPDVWAAITHLRRCRDALVTNPMVLDQWVRRSALGFITRDEATIRVAFGIPADVQEDEYTLIDAVLPTLPPATQRYFRGDSPGGQPLPNGADWLLDTVAVTVQSCACVLTPVDG